jgi:PPK2 family polyphosphate:nucleotide phosphotransferase
LFQEKAKRQEMAEMVLLCLVLPFCLFALLPALTNFPHRWTIASMPIDADNVVASARELVRPFVITDGENFRLSDHDPGNTLHFDKSDKKAAKKALKTGVKALAQFQDVLYAQDRWALLLIFQAMDAAGKDGAIKHVMSGVNPQGCQVSSFKAPSSEDLDHDFLWRCMKRLPNRGHIGIFNRSYYEETLIVRVHPKILAHQKIPAALLKSDLWQERFKDIRHFEGYLGRQGLVVRKFFLHLSPEEQRRRFLARIDNTDKNWKFSASDAQERGFWKEYQHAYEETIRQTASPEAPWLVVPADNKWFSRLVVAAAVIDTLAGLDLHYPEVTDEQKRNLETARQALENEAPLD